VVAEGGGVVAVEVLFFFGGRGRPGGSLAPLTGGFFLFAAVVLLEAAEFLGEAEEGVLEGLLVSVEEGEGIVTLEEP
jgi:hypothetical protein